MDRQAAPAAETVRVTVDAQGIAELRLCRPESRNAMDGTMARRMLQALQELAQQRGIRGLVLRAEGKHFCAGMDLQWMLAGTDASREQLLEDSRLVQSLYRAVHDFPLPTAAVVQGAAIGGGLGLASACDVVVAHKDAVFCASEVRIGLIPGMLLPLLVQRLGQGAARQIGALALNYSASEMQQLGLVTRVGEDMEQLEAQWLGIREAMLAVSPDAVAEFKRVFARIDWGRVDDAFAPCLEAMVESRLSQSAKDGLTAIGRREAAPWAGGRA